ncbi:MAG: DUF4905 domain-containing protein [Siphonobacter sp.]
MLLTSFNIPVFKVLPDPYQARLGIELRDHASKKVFFQRFTFNQELRFESSQELPWWSSTLGLYNGILLTHAFAQPELPTPTALEAYDSHQIRWQCPGAIFTKANESQVEYTKDHNLELAQLQTGQLIDNPFEPFSVLSIKTPIHYPEGNQYLEAIQRFIRILTGNRPIGACEYLELANSIIISYYFYESEKLKNELLAVTKTGRILFQENLQTSTGLGFLTFIYWQSHLFFVKEHVYLCSYAIS